jgi:sodium/proline symporter
VVRAAKLRYVKGMETGTLISLGLYFAAMLAIGVYAFRKSTSDMSGYVLGGRGLSPGVTALSAGASDMSGWLLMGLPGAVFLGGVAAGWIAIGLIAGALANYLIVAPRLRVFTERAGDALTIPDYFEKRFQDKSRALRVISSLVIVIFFTVYTSSGMVAGGKLFETAFGGSYMAGLMITTAVTLAYTLVGGFLAVSLTDVVQGTIMFVALILVPIVALTGIGGVGEATQILNEVNPALLNIFTGTTLIGIISAVAWGLGYFGQPHIIVRFMAIRSFRDIPAARNIGMSWMVICLVGAVSTGLVGLAYATRMGLAVNDPETVFIILSDVLFHPVITGFLLAAILSAVMSTISSQLLVASSSLTEDFYGMFFRRNAGQKELVTVGRLSVLAVTIVAVFMALDANSSILSIVANAWAGFGAAFGPLIILSLTWRRMTKNGALAGMIVGAVTVLVWVYAPLLADGAALSSVIYEIIPGFILSWIAIVVVSLMGRAPEGEVVEAYDRAHVELASKRDAVGA